MITIYHNPRCSKSREGLEKLKAFGKEYKIREYLKEELSKKELTQLIKKLNINPEALIRKNEKVWKENYKGRDLNDDELINAMLGNPKLIERPIIESKEMAVIGRPVSNIDQVL
ncbi:arsenate reductase (glutaredoxin) [Gillisia sp. M10.2A]|uniref:Arsenate reductase (Glutaredoxin) n=1 Tax=Gillisia lutea TaxID=2909668 RepID=A0ABS9EF13_9FLAO|nr:arsenate reductase (glutaredoxin) [Gillisia lutea]MCF4101470.1 arsenate reductase (glutaredoxin) [Gillisia lutea]